MILHYRERHKSVGNAFGDIILPDFVVLTGKNGSGKTHILTGIKEGKFQIDDIDKREILYLSYLDFSQNFQTRTNRIELINTWERFTNPNDQIGQMKQMGDIMVPFRDIIEGAAAVSNRPIFSLTFEDLQEDDEELKLEAFNAIIAAKTNINEIIYREHFNNDHIVLSVVDSVFRQTKIIPSNLKETDFYSLFQKTVFGNSKILSDLSQVFFEYFKNIQRNELKKATNVEYLDEGTFLNTFGPPPWELVRNIFTGFGLHFDINDPVKAGADAIDGSFSIEFINLDRDDAIVSFNDLSSGEQILITLINAIYTAGNRSSMPKLILLDEIDSPLNPSILDKFILYILENFVSNEIKVIIATHSPSTVAFSPEDSIYLVNTTEAIPLKGTDSNHAINKLSEGFITLSDVMKFEDFPQSRIIISEGKNFKYLSKAKQVFAPDDDDLAILDFNIGGTSQLRALFDFMRNFNRSKTFIFVFDCDYHLIEVRDDLGGLVKDATGVQQYRERDFEPLREGVNLNNQLFVFKENADSQSSRGIENLFNIATTINYPGQFDEKGPKNKKGLEKYILSRNENGDYVNFESLFSFINDNENNLFY